MRQWAVLVPVVLVATTGCLATKGDIRLLQDDLQATRSQLAAQVAQGDTTIFRTEEARRAQVAQLAATIDRMNDSLRVLSTRFAAFQATVNGELDAMGKQMVSFQALLGQNTANVQATREQLRVLREQAGAALTTGSAPDTAQRGGSGVPGAATLFATANEQLRNGNFNTARVGFETMLATYPNDENASTALLHVADAWKGLGNMTAADSVYQLVVSRYPRSPDAAPALYRRGRILWDDNKKAEARALFNQLLKEYPRADEVDIVNSLLRRP